MILDNLKDINSTADLFTYICKVEQELEEVSIQRNKLLVQNDELNNRISELETQLADSKHLVSFYADKLSMKVATETETSNI